MKILYKLASRCRPAACIKAIENIQQYARHDDYHILVTADYDDASMFNAQVNEQINQYQSTSILYGTSANKIEAINRDMPLYQDWDILINMSDDIEFIKYGFDKIIIADFEKYRSLDLLIHYPDQKAGFAMITMAIMGKEYYNRDGYIYNPVYKSLYCDNEQMEVSKIRGRYKYIKTRLFNHNNPMHGLAVKDDLFLRNNAYHAEDKATFEKRKLDGFI